MWYLSCQKKRLIPHYPIYSQGVSYSGFLWDSSSGVDLRDAAVLEPPVVNGNGNNSSPRLYLAHFTVSKVDVVLNVMCACAGTLYYVHVYM